MKKAIIYANTDSSFNQKLINTIVKYFQLNGFNHLLADKDSIMFDESIPDGDFIILVAKPIISYKNLLITKHTPLPLFYIYDVAQYNTMDIDKYELLKSNQSEKIFIDYQNFDISKLNEEINNFLIKNKISKDEN